MNDLEMSDYGFGNPIVFKNDEWIMCDTGERYWDEEVFKNLICPRCGLKATEDGHDPCIANLPNVDFACCGHGLEADKIGYQLAYIMYSNGEVIRYH